MFYCCPAFGTKLFKDYGYRQFGDAQFLWNEAVKQKKLLEKEYREKFQICMHKV